MPCGHLASRTTGSGTMEPQGRQEPQERPSLLSTSHLQLSSTQAPCLPTEESPPQEGCAARRSGEHGAAASGSRTFLNPEFTWNPAPYLAYYSAQSTSAE